MKTKKTILFFLLALIGAMQGAWAQNLLLVSNEDELKSNLRDGVTLILENDINITREVVIDGNKSVVIELNGCTINRGLTSATNYGHVFKILSGSTLTISDFTGDNSGAVKGGYTNHGGAINNAGTFIFESGTICDNHSNNEGAGIWNHDGGTVIINGGVISDNEDKNGGGICNEATLTINGGTIKENKANGGNGGGIWNSGTLTIYGGSIQGNEANSDGGGIWNSGSLYIHGGTIDGNIAKSNGGGICNSGTFDINDGGIQQNRANEGNGGGIWNSATLTIRGGRIEMNRGVSGGGVCCSDGTATFGGGIITQNQTTAEDYHIGNGVFYEDGSLNIWGNPVISGNYYGDNLFMSAEKKINVTGAIGSDAKIGYTWPSESSSTFTNGFSFLNPGTDPNTVFISDKDEEIYLKDNEVYQVSSLAFVTDLMVISHGSHDNIEKLKKKYKNRGWSLIDVDLNSDSGGNFIYLLYRKGNRLPITGLYLKCGDSSSAPETLTSNGRTYTKAYADGPSDLNSGAGGDYIFLYYTKEIPASNGRAITGITITTNSEGALGENGGSTPCDLNAGWKGPAGNIYLHFYHKSWGGDFLQTRVPYIDLDGTTKTVSAKIINANNAVLPTGWYVVSEDVNIPNERFTVQGSVNIILADGKKFTNVRGIDTYEGRTLTIWGQSGGTGELLIQGGDGEELLSAGIGGNGNNHNSGRITINGGTINSTGFNFGAGIGGGTDGIGYVTINGGTVTATGGYRGAGIGGGGGSSKGYVTINGGTVTATGGYRGAGIGGGFGAKGSIVNITGGNIRANRGANSGDYYENYFPNAGIGDSNGATISLDYTNDVSIYATNYLGTVTLQKDFLDTQNNYYPSGEVTDNSILSGKTLVPGAMVVLVNDADNSSTLNTYNGKKCVVTLDNRTFYKDGNWSTLCLPFSLANISGTPLVGATVKTLASTDFSNGTLTLTFGEDLTSIEAGKPYIVRWGDSNPTTISSTAEWNAFAANVNSGEPYANKIVRLAADIDISTPVGTYNHPFMGIFDGQGHTLNCSITDTETQGTAPFRCIYGATILNVKTTGTVKGTMHCAGLVGIAKTATDYSTSGTLMVNTINNCEVAAAITCGGTTHTHCGGILGHGTKTATTIKDCLFSGSITGATSHTGIIYGWGDTGRHTIINCLAAGTSYDGCNGVDMIKGGEMRTVINCYKTQDIGERGTYTNATGDLLAAKLGSEWGVRLGKVVPKTDAVAKIENPMFHGVIINGNEPTEVTPPSGYVTFTGTFGNMDEAGVNPDGHDTKPGNDVLFLGDNNTLYYSPNAVNINAFRAFFRSSQVFGDVNGDGYVNVTDVTMLVDLILGNANENIIEANADINADGIINVTDVTTLVNLILQGSNNNFLNVVVNGADGLNFGGSGNGPVRARND